MKKWDIYGFQATLSVTRSEPEVPLPLSGKLWTPIIRIAGRWHSLAYETPVLFEQEASRHMWMACIRFTFLQSACKATSATPSDHVQSEGFI